MSSAGPDDLPGRLFATAPAELLAAIIASTDDAIVSKDLTGVVLSWNGAAERMFGYTAPEMIGQPIARIFPPDRLDEEPRILDRLKRGERVDHFETVRLRKDGRPLEVSVTISPIHGPDGRVIGASKIARDVTAINQMLRERDNLLRSEQAARAEAERASRTKDEFLATLSHELRTPLNAILGWTQVLRGGSADADDVVEGLSAIERNARAQAQLVDDLLDMSRIIAGKVRLDVRRIDLPQVVAEAVDTVRHAADAKGVRLFKVIDPAAGPITGDANRIRQVVWNLLTNAVKFTPRGQSVHVHVQRVNSHVEVVVADTGQGIEPAFIPSLFNRFAQADASTTRAHGGLGLGLAIVRHLVELHGGTARGSSPGPGQGATFTVALPLAAVVEARGDDCVHPTAADPPRNRTPFQVDLTGVCVLVIDDEPDARSLVRRVLEQSGARVVSVASAAEGLDAVQRDRPDLVLSDIGMPDMDGYGFVTALRQLAPEEGGQTPAVALTAFARSEDRRRALMAGFQMHLPKPVDTDELTAVVSSMTRFGSTRGGR